MRVALVSTGAPRARLAVGTPILSSPCAAPVDPPVSRLHPPQIRSAGNATPAISTAWRPHVCAEPPRTSNAS